MKPLQLILAMLCITCNMTGTKAMKVITIPNRLCNYSKRHKVMIPLPHTCITSADGPNTCCQCLWGDTLWANYIEYKEFYKDYQSNPQNYRRYSALGHLPAEPFVLSKETWVPPIEAFNVKIEPGPSTMPGHLSLFFVSFQCRLTLSDIGIEQLYPNVGSPRSPNDVVHFRTSGTFRTTCPSTWPWQRRSRLSQRPYDMEDRIPQMPEMLYTGHCHRPSGETDSLLLGYEELLLDIMSVGVTSPLRYNEGRARVLSETLSIANSNKKAKICHDIPRLQEHADTSNTQIIATRATSFAGTNSESSSSQLPLGLKLDVEGFLAQINMMSATGTHSARRADQSDFFPKDNPNIDESRLGPRPRNPQDSMSDVALSAELAPDGMFELIATAPDRHGMPLSTALRRVSPT